MKMLSQHCSIFGLFIVLHLSVISGDTPWIHPMHTIYKQYPEDIQHTSAAGYQGEFLSLSRDQLIHIKRMLRRVPYRNPLLDVIREAASQVERGLDIDVSMDDILPNPEDKLIELWNYDEEFQKIVTEYLSTVTQTEIKFLSNTNDIPYPEERNQTQGHFGCIPDFDSYIGPITKRWLWDTLTLNNETLTVPRPETPERTYSFSKYDMYIILKMSYFNYLQYLKQKTYLASLLYIYF